MITTFISTPALNDPIDVLVDWLEINAFLDDYGSALVDDITESLKQQLNEPEDDIAYIDTRNEDLKGKIEDEISFREEACSGAYPFVLSSDGEELTLIKDFHEHKYLSYMVCLLASHVSSGRLYEFKLDSGLVTELRNRIFQIISTIAMAGLTPGMAVSVGWPRVDNSSVLNVLQRAQKLGAGFVARKTPGIYTPPQVKDGGIDIISWCVSDRCPPAILYYGQVASGKNWYDKPVTNHIQTFEDNFLDGRPRGNKAQVTLIPFRITEDTVWMNQHLSHGALLDRTRLPRYAKIGLGLASSGLDIDEVPQLPSVITWLDKFKNAARV